MRTIKGTLPFFAHRVDGILQLADVDILKLQLLLHLCYLLVLLLHSLGKIGDDLLEFIALERALAHLLLQLCDQVLVLLHHRLDELEVLGDALLGIGAFAILGQGYTVLGLGDLAESLLDVNQCGHHVVDLVILLGDYLVK